MRVKRAIALLFVPLALATVTILLFVVVPAHGGWDGDWYWKDGGWIDYAPNGVPDFDQKQSYWGPGGVAPCDPANPIPAIWSFCGPVAAANSLWWFDSNLEPFPQTPQPGILNDSYYLVQSYGPLSSQIWDDHDHINVAGTCSPPPASAGLVDDLAWYFDTDGRRTGIMVQGTEVHSMTHGLQWYLFGDHPQYPQWLSPLSPRKRSYYDDYHVQLVKMPTWDWVVEEVQRSEDVILLLGFWQKQPYVPLLGDDAEISNGDWIRMGGHYVTVAGINANDLQIALSDPFFDNAEAGGAGYWYTGTLLAPHNPGHGPLKHNDAGNVSHDVYNVILPPEVTSPHGLWEIEGYPYDPCEPAPKNFKQQNSPNEFIPYETDCDDPLNPVYVEVEYALAMSPFVWKPGGEWVWYEEGSGEWWWYEDDGDSCLPDFGIPGGMEVFLDGPLALANSFWWFDSKAETLLTGGMPTPPPSIADHYSMTVSYNPFWDDHDPQNTGDFVAVLAKNYLNTSLQGTDIASMTAGIDTYLAQPGVAGDFYTETLYAPTWEWITKEVETCEDVILLLGFYEDIGPEWERKGGHWVNAAGVSPSGMFLGLSDPAIDNANHESISEALYLGRVFPPEHLGKPFAPPEKDMPQNISHDIYGVTPVAEFDGKLLLEDYPFTYTSVLSNYVGLNEGGDLVDDWSNEFVTVIDWAIGVSPHSDLIITKTAEVTEVVPGDRFTYTLEYVNAGLAAAEEVVIIDWLPLELLTDLTITSSPKLTYSLGATLVLTRPKLTYGQVGRVTISAESLVTMPLSNTAYITGMTAIGSPTPDRDPTNNASKVGPDCIDLTKVTIDGAESGLPGTYTLTTTYEPPNATTPAFLWDDGTTAPTWSDYLDVGTHTLTVTATNCTDALETASHTIVITPGCVEVQMVELTLVSSTPIHVGDEVEFEAELSPDEADKPYNYRLTIDGDVDTESTSSDDPLTFTRTFTTTGVYEVQVAVWNCSMDDGDAETSTIDVEVSPYLVYLPLVFKSQ